MVATQVPTGVLPLNSAISRDSTEWPGSSSDCRPKVVKARLAAQIPRPHPENLNCASWVSDGESDILDLQACLSERGFALELFRDPVITSAEVSTYNRRRMRLKQPTTPDGRLCIPGSYDLLP